MIEALECGATGVAYFMLAHFTFGWHKGYIVKRDGFWHPKTDGSITTLFAIFAPLYWSCLLSWWLCVKLLVSPRLQNLGLNSFNRLFNPKEEPKVRVAPEMVEAQYEVERLLAPVEVRVEPKMTRSQALREHERSCACRYCEPDTNVLHG